MRRALLALAVAALPGCGGGGEEPREPRRSQERPAQAPGAPGPISAADVRAHLERLEAIAERNGDTRSAGTPGEQQTIDYVAGVLREAGWTVRLQDVRWPIFENRRRPALGDLRYRDEFVTAEYSGSDDFTGRIRPFDNQGCSSAALGDLGERDIAVVARGTCTFRAKETAAQRAGAGALVVVDREESEPVAATLGDPEGIDIPVLAATGDAAAKLVQAGRARVLVDTVSETKTTQNVIADTPKREDGRVAMAGAHLDSVRQGPGINDNGSGIAALLELARREARTPGLRLGFWTAEELGLFGSRHYVRELSQADRRRLAAYVNLDMVGTPKGDVVVYDTDDGVEDALREHTDERGEEDLGGDSDHAPFATAGVKIGGIFTGVDRCYHRACDTVANTDPARAAAQARATQDALIELAR